MRVWDTFMLRDELDMLECRLTELENADIWRHVIVEAKVTQQGRPKPLWFLENRDRFSPWLDRIVYVIADTLPDSHDPWVREHAQREHAARGLAEAEPGDVLLHSDLDEILTPEGVERAKFPGGGLRFRQRCAVFAVDWLLPWSWDGPVAAHAGQVRSFAAFRGAQFPAIDEGGGWHLSWLGGNDAIRAKLGAYCHTEMDDYIIRGLKTGQFYERGIFWGHGQGDTQLLAADVDQSWPRWVYERKCPATWFRPRGDST